MCLVSKQFALDWDDAEGDYVGRGFKVISKPNMYNQLLGNSRYIYFLNKWLDCRPPVTHDKTYANLLPLERQHKLYYPNGFHIFCKFEDAKMYQNARNMQFYDIYNVIYKELLAIGENELYNIYIDGCYGRGQAIVARYMKIISKIEETPSA
jgi:hypothetical protein